MKKSLLFTACGVLLATVGSGCKEEQKAPAAAMMKQPPPAVVTSKVELKDNIEKRSYAGVVTSPAVVTLMPRISGELLNVGFSEGQVVKKNQLLYTFDKTRYQAAVANAKAKVAEGKAHISECQAKLEFAKSDYEMKQGLRNVSVTSRIDLENAESVLKSAQAATHAAQASLAAANAQLITAQDDLDNCEIKAPMDGVIGINNFAAGNYVTPSSGALATINQITPIRVEFAMSNRDFLEMFGTEEKLQKEAVLKLKLADDSMFNEIGKVEFIDNNVNRRTDTVQVFAVFPNAKRQLRPGSSVSVTIERKLASQAPAIPPSALLPSANKFFVYIVEAGNLAARREVKVTTMRDDYVFISEGLKAGDTIISDGTHKVRIMKPGDKFPVVPVPAVPAAVPATAQAKK